MDWRVETSGWSRFGVCYDRVYVGSLRWIWWSIFAGELSRFRWLCKLSMGNQMTVNLAIFLCMMAGFVGGLIGAGTMMIVFFPELKRPDSLEGIECDRCYEIMIEEKS